MNLKELRQQPHLSYSALSTFLMCPLKFKFHYLDKIPDKSIASCLIFGSAIHDIIGTYYASFHENNEKPDQEWLVSEFEKIWKELVAKQILPIDYKPKSDFEALLDTGRKMVKAFHEAVTPGKIEGLEVPFSIEIPEVPAPLIGAFDVMEAGCLIELKTAARKYSDTQISNNLQCNIYGLAMESLGLVEDTLIKLLVITKTKEPEVQPCYIIVDRKQNERTVRLIQTIWKSIQAGNFYPLQNFTCGDCQYSKECKQF